MICLFWAFHTDGTIRYTAFHTTTISHRREPRLNEVEQLAQGTQWIRGWTTRGNPVWFQCLCVLFNHYQVASIQKENWERKRKFPTCLGSWKSDLRTTITAPSPQRLHRRVQSDQGELLSRKHTYPSLRLFHPTIWRPTSQPQEEGSSMTAGFKQSPLSPIFCLSPSVSAT